jgi:hypothetical protein
MLVASGPLVSSAARLQAWSTQQLGGLQKLGCQTASDVWNMVQKLGLWSRPSDDNSHDIEADSEESGSDSGCTVLDPPCFGHSAIEHAKEIERQVLGAITQLPSSLPAVPKQIQKLWRPASGQNLLPVTMPTNAHGKN